MNIGRQFDILFLCMVDVVKMKSKSNVWVTAQTPFVV